MLATRIPLMSLLWVSTLLRMLLIFAYSIWIKRYKGIFDLLRNDAQQVVEAIATHHRRTASLTSVDFGKGAGDMAKRMPPPTGDIGRMLRRS